jgi:hypothetical protein
MDYSRYLVLYSGGADSTHFIEQEPTARHLLHYRSRNEQQTKVALINANILNRYIEVVTPNGHPNYDGETNETHALFDTEMALNACIKAAHFGMAGIVLCFNSDDIGIEVDALLKIMRRVEPNFEILQPLRNVSAKKIRTAIKESGTLRYVSCMHSDDCGFCAKCLKTY